MEREEIIRLEAFQQAALLARDIGGQPIQTTIEDAGKIAEFILGSVESKSGGEA